MLFNISFILVLALQAALAMEEPCYPFICENNNTIDFYLVCNDRNDCGDNSDESCDACVDNNLGKCCPDNTTSYTNSYACDRYCDCKDDCADEYLCSCGCKHLCDNNTVCLPEHWKCDGVLDCSDGTDEKDCPVECTIDQFHCDNKCIPIAWKCDNETQCDDYTDEFDCPCEPDKYKCPESGECIPFTYLCDQYIDCKDGTDEECVMALQPTNIRKNFKQVELSDRKSVKHLKRRKSSVKMLTRT